MFELDPAFTATSAALVSLPLCEARLQLDARFAWIVLIPRVAGAVELADLDEGARATLMEEIVLAGTAVRAVAQALGRPAMKLNVGQLGNITRQLHVHVVGRREDDPCWPGPVWGQGTARAYDAGALAAAIVAGRQMLPSPLRGGVGGGGNSPEKSRS
ncbi:MAG TPA: HIT domain-containing protein [Caulobacteraceae bacterium]|jgi:diadenosine tetraphosphate (Ap4A) HIT family hydrolase|nr:HIT domain-containing protein [Caulobacteraceae bacterium]